jgi:hypothetical protein
MSTDDFDELSFLQRKQRKADKKKQRPRGPSEDVQESRGTRLTFKNYVREVNESIYSSYDEDDWILESSDDGEDWHEVTAFITEEEAQTALDEHQESNDGLLYRLKRG